MDYIELRCTINPYSEDHAGILTALLANLGFESFAENDDRLCAYIPSSDFDVTSLEEIDFKIIDKASVSFDHKIIKEKNWNALWESNFKPVIISGKCMVRAPFHEQDPKIEYDIIIEPKMSFGTAHHETTDLMIQSLLNETVSEMTVLDMGCGTGILAILAYKLGAKSINAIDNDEWAYNNSLDNVKKNNCHDILVQYGDASLLSEKKYDIILANINRNILLNDIPAYHEVLNKGGVLLLSGFYEKDLPVITEKAVGLSLSFDHHKVLNDWVVAKFIY